MIKFYKYIYKIKLNWWCMLKLVRSYFSIFHPVIRDLTEVNQMTNSILVANSHIPIWESVWKLKFHVFIMNPLR